MRGERPAFPAIVSLLPLTTYVLLVTSPLSLLTGCDSSPEEKLQQAHQQLASWEATARLTGELAGRGALPAVYVRQVREAVEQGREKTRQQAAKISR